MGYQIISDSSCDLDKSITKKNNIRVIPFYVSFDGENYKKENEEIEVWDFYMKMIENEGVFPKTSLPSVDDYAKVFEEYASAGTDMVCICISSKFSGSYNSAIAARDLILETYPDIQIKVVDAAVNTVLQGLLVLEAVKMRDVGYPLEKLVEEVERIKQTGRIFFTVGNMDYLIHGGRVGKVMKVAVNALKIRPLIVLKDGEIFPTGVTRSRKKSLNKIMEQVEDYFKDSGENPVDYEIVIGYGYDLDEAKTFRDELLSSMERYSSKKTIEIFQIGAMIGVHTGPYPLGVGLLKKYNV